MKNNFTILLEKLLVKIDNEQERFDKRHSAYLRFIARQANSLKNLNKLGKVSNSKTSQVKGFDHHLTLPKLYDKSGFFSGGETLIQLHHINSRTKSTWTTNSLHYNIYSEIPENPKQNPVTIEQGQILIDNCRDEIVRLIEVSKRPVIILKDIDIPENTLLEDIQVPRVEKKEEPQNKEDIVTVKRTHVKGPKRSVMELSHMYMKVNNAALKRKKINPEIFKEIEEIEDELKSHRRYLDIKYLPYKQKTKNKR